MSRKFLVRKSGLEEVEDDDILTEQQIVERLQALVGLEDRLQRTEKQLSELLDRHGRVIEMAHNVAEGLSHSLDGVEKSAFFAALRDFLTHGDGDISVALPGVNYEKKWGIKF